MYDASYSTNRPGITPHFVMTESLTNQQTVAKPIQPVDELARRQQFIVSSHRRSRPGRVRTCDRRIVSRNHWARADLEITYGRIVLLGDDDQDPVPARIISFNETNGIITVEVLFDEAHSAVA